MLFTEKIKTWHHPKLARVFVDLYFDEMGWKPDNAIRLDPTIILKNPILPLTIIDEWCKAGKWSHARKWEIKRSMNLRRSFQEIKYEFTIQDYAGCESHRAYEIAGAIMIPAIRLLDGRKHELLFHEDQKDVKVEYEMATGVTENAPIHSSLDE